MNATPGAAPASGGASDARLLRARLTMVLNTAFKQGRQRRGVATVIAIVAAGGLLLSYQIAGVVFDVATPGPSGLMHVVAGALALLTGFTAVTSITFALSSLYFARDLDLLHAAPLRARQIIRSRIETQLALGLALGTLIAGPPLLAYTASLHRVWALPLLAVTIVAVVALPLCAATVFTVVALRLVPARFARDAGGLVVTVAVFAVAAVNLAVRGVSGFTSAPGPLPFAAIGAGPAGAAWSPPGAGARAIAALLQGDVTTWLVWSAPLVVIAALLPAAVARLLEGVYLTGYQRNAMAPARRRRRRRTRLGRPPLPAWATIAAKDLRSLRRDPSQMGQLLLPLVLFALYLGTPGRGAGGAGILPSWYLIALNASFASLLFAGNIALRGVGTEGPRLWLLRLAPVRSIDILAAKYAAGFVIAALPACLLLWVGELRAGESLPGLLWPTFEVCLMIAGVVGIAVGLGAALPRLDWTDPRRAVGIGVVLLFLGIGTVYLMGCFIALAVAYGFDGGTAGSVVVADLLVVALTVVAGGGALALGGRRLARLDV